MSQVLTTTSPRHRLLGLSALSAAAVLVLSACSGDQPAGTPASEDTAAPTATEQATQDATAAAPTETDAPQGEGEATEYEPGTCFTGTPGSRDVANFEEVDCEDEHFAEYVWAVPADESAGEDADAEEGEEAEAVVPTESVCRDVVTAYGEDLDVVISATELRNSDDMSLHCILYSVTDPWTGQAIDPEITLESATQEYEAAQAQS